MENVPATRQTAALSFSCHSPFGLDSLLNVSVLAVIIVLNKDV